MNKKIALFILGMIWVGGDAFGQSDIPLGSWRAHYNYSEIYLVEAVNDKIFAVGESGVLVYNTTDERISQLTKIDGLAESRVTAIAFNEDKNTLVLGYWNGNIDVIREDGITNVSSLLESGIVETKTIKHISFHGDLAYLSTAFGIVVLDLERDRIQTAYQNLGPNGEKIQINASDFLRSELFLATDVGVISADVESGLLLEDFNNWTRYQAAPFEGSNVISINVSFGDGVGYAYVATTTNVYGLVEEVWQRVDYDLSASEEIKILTNSENIFSLNGQNHYVLTNQGVLGYGLNGVDVIDIQRITNYPIAEDLTIGQESIWFASLSLGLTNSVISLNIDSPINEQTDKLKFIDGDMLAFPKLDENTSSKSSNGFGYAIFRNGTWTIIEPDDLSGLDNISDIVTKDNGPFMSSFGSGLLDSANSIVYNESNSLLRHYQGVLDNIIATGLGVDSENNLWIANFSDNSLLTLSEGGNWNGKDFGFSAAEEPMSMLINGADQIWMTLGRTNGQGLLGYDPSENIFRHFNIAGAQLPSNQVNQLAMDLDGDLWMATGDGVAFIPFAFASIADNSLDAQLPIYDGGFLFAGRTVTSIAVDGGNRKWIGSNNGVWLFNENGNELVHHFETSNSPLPSNNVLAIAINQENGEVFISTDNGLISYRSDATTAGSTHQQVKIFPNPVTPDFTGWVGFDGLAANVLLKITTISGRLVREIQANGGAASWDIKDYTGNRPKTGVYLVFSANADGSETFVGKIAIIE